METNELELRLSFTQPICELCWNIREPNRIPTNINLPEVETCCVCGTLNMSGIYIRIDPVSVKYPTLTKD